jgi:hypothetical protein
MNGQSANGAQVNLVVAGGFDQTAHFKGDFGWGWLHRTPVTGSQTSPDL